MTAKNKIRLSIIIFLASVSLVFAFIIYPILEEIKDNSKEFVSQKENLLTLKAEVENLEEFKTLYREAEGVLGKIDNLFINPEVPVGFIGFLETISQERQIEIKMIPSSVKKGKKDPWPSLNFQVTATGLFPDFLSFLEKVENSPYLVEIQNLSINRLTGSEISDAKAVFTIKVFAK